MQEKSQKENEPMPAEAAVVACMDDAISFGKGVYWIGLGGSLVTASAPTEKFGQEAIDLVNRTRAGVFSALSKICTELGIPLAVTSHDGCGWCGAQSIKAEDVPALTKQMADGFAGIDINFLGNIGYAQSPALIDQQTEVEACITRTPEDHHHTAGGIIITAGGFIDNEGVEFINRRNGWKGAFVISADWLTQAVLDGMPKEDAIALIKLQVDLANKIMGTKLMVEVFDANLIGNAVAFYNRRYIKTLLE